MPGRKLDASKDEPPLRPLPFLPLREVGPLREAVGRPLAAASLVSHQEREKKKC